MYKIAVIPGDGIGKEVMEATLHILEASDIEFEYSLLMQGTNMQKKLGYLYPERQ